MHHWGSTGCCKLYPTLVKWQTFKNQQYIKTKGAPAGHTKHKKTDTSICQPCFWFLWNPEPSQRIEMAVLRQAVTNCNRRAGTVHDRNLMFGDRRNNGVTCRRFPHSCTRGDVCVVGGIFGEGARGWRARPSNSTRHCKWTLPTLQTSHFKIANFKFRSTQYTPHATRHTLHSTLYPLRSTLYSWHSTLYTEYSPLSTLHSTLDTLHSTITLYAVHPTVELTLHTLHPHSTLHSLHSTLYTPHPELPPAPHFTVSNGTVISRGRVYKTVAIRWSVFTWCVIGFGVGSCVFENRSRNGR